MVIIQSIGVYLKFAIFYLRNTMFIIQITTVFCNKTYLIFIGVLFRQCRRIIVSYHVFIDFYS